MPLLETNLRAEPCETLHATDPSPGGCSLALYDLAEEKGEHVHLDWKGEEPPSNMHDVREAAALLALKLNWGTMFSYPLFKGPDQPPQAGHT